MGNIKMSVETETISHILTNNGDHEKFAHYVHKNDSMISIVEGKPIQALCGKIWIPTRDGSKFPLCPECKKIFDTLKK